MNKQYMVSNELILRNDNPYKEEYRAILVDEDKTFKFTREGFLLLTLLNEKMSIEEISNKYNSLEGENKIDIKKITVFIAEGIKMGLITDKCYENTMLKNEEKFKFPFKQKYFSFPEDAIISLTGKCNLKCKHCMAIDISKQDCTISLEKFKSLFDELENYGLISLKLSGRESTLNKNIYTILEYASKKRFVTTLLSNGTTFDDVSIQFLAKLKEKRKKGFNLAISLDGENSIEHDYIRGEGSFDLTICNIRKLILYNFIPVINTVIHKKNHLNMEKFIIMLIDLGIQVVSLSLLFEIG